MLNLLLKATYSALSLGQVGLNFTRAFHKAGVNLGLFPIGDKVDFEPFDELEKEVKEYIVDAAQNRFRRLKKDIPSLAIWHINGSENRVCPKQYLYTFYEVDSPTIEELSIVESQEHTFFSSSFAAAEFRKRGCNNVSHVPLGVDPFLKKTNKEYLAPDVIHWGLIGKFERRKNTKAIIQLWLKKFGNDPKHQLTCLINNGFLKEEIYNQLIVQTLGGKNWSNVNLLPQMKLNSQVNDLYSAIDIDLSGLSNGEGWNLPAFNATALGKWSIVSNCSSHRDWANSSNSILVDPIGKQDCYDDVFFTKNGMFNQGQYFQLGAQDIVDAMDKALEKAKTPNIEGEKLREKFTYENSAKQILDSIYGN